MKRILSVILSLALLASLLIVPMSVSAVTATDACKAVIDAVEELKFNDNNLTSSLQEFAVPAGSNPGGNGNTFSKYNANDQAVKDGEKVAGQFKHVDFEPFNTETGFTNSSYTVPGDADLVVDDVIVGDSCMQLVDDATLTENPELGSKAVKVLKNHATTSTAWGSNPQNTIRYTLNGVNQNEGIYLYDIGYLVIYVKTDVALNFNLYTHTGWALSNICDNQKVSDTKGEYVPVVIDLTAFNWNQTDSRKNCFAFRKPITLIVLSIFKDDGTAIDTTNNIVFGSMKYVPFEKALRDFKYDFDLETLGGYKATSAADGSVEMNGGTKFTDKTTNGNLLRYRNANKDSITYSTDTVADIIARAETISNDAGYYTDASFQNLQEKIAAAKAAFVGGGEVNQLALLKAEASKLYKTEEIAQPLFRWDGKIENAQPDISDFGLTDYQIETLGSRYIVVDSSDTADYYYKKPGAEDRKVFGDEWDINIQDYDEVILPIYNNSNQKWLRNGKLQTIIEPKPNDGPKDSNNSSKYLNFAIYDNDGPRTIPVLEGLNTIDLADLWIRVYYKGVSQERLFKNYSDFREYNTAIASKLGVPDYDNLTVLNISPKYWDNVWTSNLREGQTWILGSITGKKYLDLTTEMTNAATVSEFVSELYTQDFSQKYDNTTDILDTLNTIGYTNIEVVKEIANDIGILDTNGEQYSFGLVEIGSEVSFKLDVTSLEGTGAKPVVKYDGKIIVPVSDVYTITVAEGAKLSINPSYKVNEYKITTDAQFNSYYTTTNNLILNQDAVIATYYPQLNKDGTIYTDDNGNRTYYRNLAGSRNITNLTDGKYAAVARDFGNDDKGINTGFPCRKYRLDGSNQIYDQDYYNGYKPYKADDPTTVFNFDRTEENPFEFYTDILFDIGYVADINKIMHVGSSAAYHSLGAYEIYASDKVEDLFVREKSLVGSYQSKDYNNINSQIWEFPSKTARFVAFRVYCLVGDSTGNANYYYNSLRAIEFGVYGTIAENQVNPGYTVSTANLHQVWFNQNFTINNKAGKNGSGLPLEYAEGLSSLLTKEEVALSISGMASGVKKDSAGTVKSSIENYNGNIKDVLNDCGFASKHSYLYFSDFKLNNNQNGYTVKRNVSGDTTFTRNADATANTYIDFTYDLGDYYDIKQFNIYGHGGTSYTSTDRIEAYEVYVANNKDSLYESGNKVAYYENIFNTTGQRLTFNESHAGKYIGVRILYSSSDSPYIYEIAAFGTPVGEPTDTNLAPNDKFNSSAAYIFNDKTYGENGSSVYVKDAEGNPTTAGIDSAAADDLRTSMRLALRYECQFTNDRPDADTIKLANGQYARILSKSIIAAQYDSNVTYDDTTFGIKPTVSNAKVVTSTESLRSYFAIDDVNTTQVSVTLNLKNMKSSLKDTPFVFRGRIVYQTTDGSIYACYTPISSQITAESAHGSLGTTWFK